MLSPHPDLPLNKISDIRTALLAWYRRHLRDLPWRGETSPYRVWISEVMLQQTQVNTVIPYYRRFLERFPAVEHLAEASLDEILKMWEGLGYYARARNLHKAAGEIMQKWAGQFPRTYAELRSLPGFGDYTAGAVASITFGEAVPAVDGNVKRVLARLFAIDTDITRNPAARQVRELAAALVDPATPGDWTQAIMELGALICLPQSPRCLLCPVQQFCQARLQGIEPDLPVKPVRKPLPHFDVTAAVIHRNGKLLIAQRPPEGMLGGLWEFPGGKQQPGETLPECLEREIREELGVEIEVGQPVIAVKHSYTHFKITLHAFHCRLISGQLQSLEVADWRWVTTAQLDDFAFPRTDQQIIAVLKNNQSTN
jgi:A/G-specific adenine glycosylase